MIRTLVLAGIGTLIGSVSAAAKDDLTPITSADFGEHRSYLEKVHCAAAFLTLASAQNDQGDHEKAAVLEKIGNGIMRSAATLRIAVPAAAPPDSGGAVLDIKSRVDRYVAGLNDPKRTETTTNVILADLDYCVPIYADKHRK